MGGISSLIVSEMILPVFSDSTPTSSSALASRRSAILRSASERCEGEVRFHVANALAATLTAWSTSDASETGDSAKGCPVTGLINSTYFPLFGGTDSPPIKLAKRRMDPPKVGLIYTVPLVTLPELTHRSQA